jgi:ABC-type polysaccharide/polyol phosphate export permease
MTAGGGMSEATPSGPASAAEQQAAISARPARALREKLVDLWRARELLRQFVSKELKVRYKNSALGFLWSLVTPVLMTVVFTVIFSTVIRIDVGGDFAAFFLAGFLVWQFFQNSVQGSISAVVGNGPLIKKVYFPREILPLSIVLSQLVHLLLAFLAVSPYLIWSRGWGIVVHLPALLFGVVVVSIFTSGVAMLLAGANVTFRDLQELIVVIMMVWFYATPIIYPFAMVAGIDSTVGRVAAVVLSYNPMTWFTRLFRESIYGTVVANPAAVESCVGTDCPPALLSTAPSFPSWELLVGTGAAAVVTFVIGYLMFHRFALTFAKEI